MLKKLQTEEFEKYADWAYNLALDRTRSCYPTYSDGIKTKQDFIESAQEAFNSESDEILLFYIDGKLSGYIHYYFLKEDNYIGIHSFNIEQGTNIALKEFEQLCHAKYYGYDLYMGFSEENTETILYFKENGYKLLEKSYPNVYHFKKTVTDKYCPFIEKIEKQTYGKFKELHSQNDGDMYWNSERILQTIESWLIFFYDDGSFQAAIYVNTVKLPEIFGIDFKNNNFNRKVFEQLINKSLAYLSKTGAKHLYYFAEGNEQNMLKKLGFVNIGIYNCYTKKIEN